MVRIGADEGIEDVESGGATRTEKREVEKRVAMGRELSRTRGAMEWRRLRAVIRASECGEVDAIVGGSGSYRRKFRWTNWSV